MKGRVPAVAFWAVALGFVGVAAVAWYLSQQHIPEARQDVAPPQGGEVARKPKSRERPAPREVVPLLKRQPWPASGEDFYKSLPPIDLDKFGDITQEVYHGQFDALKRADQARKAGKPERDVSQMLRGISEKSTEYDRQGFLDDFRRRPENKGKTDEQLRKEKEYRYGLIGAVILARTQLAEQVTLRLAGVVVDEHDQQCSDVTVEVSKETVSINANGWPTTEILAGSVKVAGSFALTIDNAHTVRLRFSKPGYHSVTHVHFTAPAVTDATVWESILAGKRIPPQQVEKRDLRIVMEKQGELTRLRSGGGTLTFRRDGTGDVLTMGVNADGYWFMRTTSGKDMSIAPPRGLPEKCVYVVPKTNNEGSVTLLRFSALESRRASEVSSGTKPEVAVLRVPDDESQYVYAPAGLRLVVSDPQGGFVRYEPQPDREIRPDRPWSRDMKEAPEEGYVDELVLDSDVMKKLFANPEEPQPVYFYIKAFGKYGKGRLDLKIVLKEAQRKYINGQLEPIRYRIDEAELAAPMHILIQPDGGRNLEGYE